MPYPFLSDEWLTAAHEVRARYEGKTAKIAAPVRMNLVVTDTPFSDEPLGMFIDTTSGDLILDKGTLDAPDLTMTTDWATARALLVEQDQAAVMQAFMGGLIKIQGDMMKLMAMQAGTPHDDTATAVAADIRSITE